MPDMDYGALAVALAKAQREFGPLARSKHVEVTTKKGDRYGFDYAPLDAILAQTRKPLADNGFALSQMLDSDGLVTMLLHSSGAYLRGVTPLPETTEVQAFGSAITYLRRYSIQAILGIAAEEDDDGNRASGNTTRREPRGMSRDEAKALEAATEPVLVGPYEGTGTFIVRKTGPADGLLKPGPDGSFFLVAFTDDEGHTVQVEVRGKLAVDIYDAAAEKLDGLACAIYGDLYRVPWKKDGKPMPPYQRVALSRIVTGEWTLPVPGQTGPGLFDAEAEKELDEIPL